MQYFLIFTLSIYWHDAWVCFKFHVVSEDGLLRVVECAEKIAMGTAFLVLEITY